MSLHDLEVARELKEIGKMLGRAGISERALEIAKEIVSANSYFKAVEGIGRMQALAKCCNFDAYWQEKREIGHYSEENHLRDAKVIAALVLTTALEKEPRK